MIRANVEYIKTYEYTNCDGVEMVEYEVHLPGHEIIFAECTLEAWKDMEDEDADNS